MAFDKSRELFKEAKKYIPGGVNSPVRAYRAVGIEPIFISHGKGSKIYDVEEKEYIDYVCSWGPLILGHAHPQILSSVREALEKGTSFGAPTELEIEMAKMIVSAVPSIEKVRMVSSGTEATMSAIRLARGFIEREKIIKFEGCYHGHADSLLVEAGSGVATLGIPGSPGITKKAASDTITLPYNNLEAVEKILNEQGGEIACLIVEPIAANMGVVPPKAGFLKGLRELTKKYGIILIFDEVITGFRVSYGGAQELYGINPDLTCLGKIIGGGFPVGAFGGKAEIMNYLAPDGPVYQAGTLSGNPVAMTAGIATLKILSNSKIYQKLEEKAGRFSKELKAAAKAAGVKASFTRVGSILSMFFTSEEVIDYTSAKKSDTDKYAKYFANMLENGVYLAPSQFEATFISYAHLDEDINKTIKAAQKALRVIRD